MALPASGPLSLGDVNVELGLARTLTIHLGATGVRTLYNVPTGAIRLAADGYGKANRVALSFVFSADTTQTSITISSLVGYVAGKADLTITINAGVTVSSNAAGTPALTIVGAAVGDTITLVNNGYVFGRGGAGGTGGGYNGAGGAGQAGSNAISLTGATGSQLFVQNRGVIGGGGGGGGGGSGASSFLFGYYYFFTETAPGCAGGGGVIGAPGGTSGSLTAPFPGPPATGTSPDVIPGIGQPGGNWYSNTRYGGGGRGGTIGTAGTSGTQGSGNNPAPAAGIGGVAGKAINLGGAIYTVSNTATNLSSVTIGASGTFTCAATTLRYGQQVTITGTNTGTGAITGYVSGNVYYIIATNGSTTFTLSSVWGGGNGSQWVRNFSTGAWSTVATAKTPVGSTAGTPVGLTFSLNGATRGVVS